MKESEKLKEAIMIVLESGVDTAKRFHLLEYLFERYKSEVSVEEYLEKKNGKGE